MFLKKQLWAWPIIAVLVLSVLGFGVRHAIETTIKANVGSGLHTLLTVETEMLMQWFAVQESTAETLANDSQVRETFLQLLASDDRTQPASDEAQTSELKAKLARELVPAMMAHKYVGFLFADSSKKIVASSNSALVGERDIPQYDEFLERAFNGESLVSPPFASVVMMKGTDGQSRMGVPIMYVVAPIRDQSFQSIVGAVAMQIRPEREFTQIMQLGRIGDSGETYAFNADGVMISNSRFDEELILLGLLPDREHAQSMLELSVRDPGQDMTEGYRPSVRRRDLPLTKMTASAIQGESGFDVDGYRDYRGSEVIGAWTWLPKYKIGLATEVDAAQAFRPLTILKRTFLAIYLLLILSAIAIFVFTVVVSRLHRQARVAVIEAQQLGQYTLEGKLGEGGMGVVYKGRHSMMRRPTAIKMLHSDKINDTTISRFEREVQITCQLNHFNTIAIYDYGRTPEGVFYYAMEFLDGIDLQSLIDRYGPQPEHRVIHILSQICNSLYEAHSKGLVHRDIKPANVMLNRRGCEPDVVKVLDFGLVKAIDQQANGANLEGDGSMTGTPLYMSPEAIQAPLSVDSRTDIYAVGAVGYFLLTGQPVFEATGIAQLCHMHIDELPVPPSKRGKMEVSNHLEDVILRCLEKSRAKRPQTARDLAQLLARCEAAGQWTVEDGDRWWGRHERGDTVDSVNRSSTVGPALDVTQASASGFDD